MKKAYSICMMFLLLCLSFGGCSESEETARRRTRAEMEAQRKAEEAAAQAAAEQAERIDRIDAIDAQVTYTAMMTDTLMTEE